MYLTVIASSKDRPVLYLVNGALASRDEYIVALEAEIVGLKHLREAYKFKLRGLKRVLKSFMNRKNELKMYDHPEFASLSVEDSIAALREEINEVERLGLDAEQELRLLVGGLEY